MAETVLQTLLSAVRDHAQHPEAETDSAPLNTALAMAAVQSGNPTLRSLVVLYLEYVGTEHAKHLIATIMELEDSDPDLNEFEGEAGNNSEVGPVNQYIYIYIYIYMQYSKLHAANGECVSNPCIPCTIPQVHRHRRGSDWDEYNSDYNAVASYSSRRSDVLTYPQHRAYLYSKKIGMSKLYAQFAAGGFVGASNNRQKYKVSCFCTAQKNGIIVYGIGSYTLYV